MKTKKVLFYLLAAVLTGCVHSLHPLFTQKEAIFDEKLIGLWGKDSNGRETLEFARLNNDPNNKLYKMIYTDKERKKGEFVATAGMLNGNMFLDIFPGELKCEQNDFYLIHLLPAHTFIKIERIEPTLEMRMMDRDQFEKIIKKDPNLIKHEFMEEQKGIVLTASTVELQQFIKKYANDPNLFNNGVAIDLKRIEPNGIPEQK